MLIKLNPKSNVPIWEQIVVRMRELMLRSVLTEGEKLPSVRELASALVVNPNTVSKAYQELERLGMIETIRGKGTFVAAFTAPQHDEQKHQKLQQQLRELLLEAIYLGIAEETIHAWIEAQFAELGGNSLAEGRTLDEDN